MSRRRRVGVLLALVPVLLGLSAAPALAHPLGNSSTNLASELRVEPDRVVVRHLVDLAELRTVQLLPAADSSGDGEVQPAEASAYAAKACMQTAGDVRLQADGRALALTPGESSLTLQPGESGLRVARLACELTAPLELEEAVRLDYRDDSYAGRFGWREVTAVFDGTTALSASVPIQSPSDRLQSYPEEGALDALPDVRTASLEVRPGGPRLSRTNDGGLQGSLPGAEGVTRRFAALVGDRTLTVPIALLALLLAVVLGAGHALTPGHGKTVMAAYLVGQEGTRRQAFTLGGIVTATHTAGVLLLGLLLLTSASIASERIVAGLQIASGLLLAAVGGSLLLRAIRRTRALAEQREQAHDHPHDHDHPHSGGGGSLSGPAGTPHGSLLVAPAPAPAVAVAFDEDVAADRVLEHDHGLGRHTHVLPDPTHPLGARSLAAMGVAGGLVPSPSALLVLLAANAAGRAWFGVLLVVAYGVGMAVTLTIAGLSLLRIRKGVASRALRSSSTSRAGQAAQRLLRALPVVTAGFIVLAAAVIVVRGLGQLASFG